MRAYMRGAHLDMVPEDIEILGKSGQKPPEREKKPIQRKQRKKVKITEEEVE
jgi:hypothetical protein